MKIVEKIIAYRLRYNLTQSQLARQLGITQQYLSKIENGDFSNMEVVVRILSKLGYGIRMRVVPLNQSKTKKLQFSPA